MKFIDLTQTFTDNMPVYPGDPASSLKQTAQIQSETYTDHLLTTQLHVGTHMDAPLHMIAGGKTIDQLALDSFFGNGVILDARNKTAIDESLLENVSLPEGAVVFVYTGFAQKYRSNEYYQNIPFMTPGFAQKMVEMKVKIVGMDTLGPDADKPWPAHQILLGSEVLIIENLANLDQLLTVTNFEVIAMPAKLQADAAPVRVIARVGE